ncbi:SurA N-terminal domain-containing protein [Oceanobacillus senegalensis]|uniref:SurA N-terminal domain-containing protein n=1 Tax=Oceanobacillus senegalensis TaxID=1936063 RepID=UPI0015C4ADFC|nr:SurA N-terminal domain-containing protein [Oceanobacillus senegalensis]
MKKKLGYMIILSMVLLLAACNNEGTEEKEGTEEATSQKEQLEFSDEERVDEEKPVVSVNGEEIAGDKYNQIYTQVKTMMYQYGQDVSNTEKLKEQVITVLVQQELINQEAAKLGIEVTDKEADEELKKIKEETGDQFTTILDQYQMDEEAFKEQLKDDLTTAEYMEEKMDTKVSDEEVEEYYNQMKEQNENIGELDEVKEDIKSILTEQKKNEQLQAKVDELKKKADIETLI